MQVWMADTIFLWGFSTTTGPGIPQSGQRLVKLLYLIDRLWLRRFSLTAE
jgi:hypothetical protein